MEMDPNTNADDPAALDADMDDDSKSDQRQGDEHSFAAQLKRVTLRDEVALGTGAETSTDIVDPQGISPERLEMLREQMAQALHGDGVHKTSCLPEAAEYGQQMWSRCEALTSGAHQTQRALQLHVRCLFAGSRGCACVFVSQASCCCHCLQDKNTFLAWTNTTVSWHLLVVKQSISIP